jgi:hypothetical protein
MTNGCVCQYNGNESPTAMSGTSLTPCILSIPRKSLHTFSVYQNVLRSRGNVAGLGTVLQIRKSQVRFAMGVTGFFILPNISSRTMALGSTQTLTEMSTRNHRVGKGRPAGA